MPHHHFRYPTIIKKNGKYDLYLGIDSAQKGKTIYLKNIKLPIKKKDILNHKKSIITKGLTAHNFTAFYSKNNELFGIGGEIKNQKPFNEFPNDSGVYLFKFIDDKWIKMTIPIISINNCPKNPILSIEEKAPLFDSNICCFYSKIINKYLLFCRANVKRACRTMQVTTSNDLFKWEPFKILNINTFKPGNNNYMFKCIEIYKKKIFFGLTPYSSSNLNPKEYHIKKLISYDSINWIDFGILNKCDIADDFIHLNVHVAEIFFDNNTLEIILAKNIYNNEPKIKKYEFKYDNKNKFEDFIKLIKI